jgi:hypothetical protein
MAGAEHLKFGGDQAMNRPSRMANVVERILASS